MTNALHLFSFLAAAVSPRVDYAEAQQQRQLRGIFDIDRVVDPHIIPSVDGPGVLASDGDDFSNGGSDGSNPCAAVIAIDYLPIPKEDVDGRLLVLQISGAVIRLIR